MSLLEKMPNLPDPKVLDSWALLAWIRNEMPAADAVEEYLRQADGGEALLFMSWINVGEVYYILVRKNGLNAADAFMLRLPSLPIRVVAPNEEDIMSAARLKATRRISYADAFAISLALKENAWIVTGDPEIRDCVSDVEWIGSPTQKDEEDAAPEH
jgi:predicted nucleic acid-binding protein